MQTLGYNPFLVMPDDPAVAWTHTDETRRMPSIRDAARRIRRRRSCSSASWSSHRTIRRVLMKIGAGRLRSADDLRCCVAWLRDTGRSPWLALVYAWNPLVILEVAHSGHIDALGALWIAVSAWMLSTGRGMRAAIWRS